MTAKTVMRINDISTLLYAAEFTSKDWGHVWWRGQADSRWCLQPRVSRSTTLEAVERSLAREFQAKAHTRYANCPDQDDYPGWLFLMQHYGLPTRLLDWSESPLVALFFAVREMQADCGALFALTPLGLNENQLHKPGLVPPHGSRIDQLVEPVFDERLSFSPSIVAVATKEIDNRMLIQQSQFTFHGSDMPLDQVTQEETFLVRFDVPSAAKTKIWQELALLGIRESTLFPDLEHLARELTVKYDYGVYGVNPS